MRVCASGNKKQLNAEIMNILLCSMLAQMKICKKVFAHKLEWSPFRFENYLLGSHISSLILVKKQFCRQDNISAIPPPPYGGLRIENFFESSESGI
jgi:hypothetical protein